MFCEMLDRVALAEEASFTTAYMAGHHVPPIRSHSGHRPARAIIGTA